MTILRTATKGCFRLQTNGWGTYLAPIPDPDANCTITAEQLDGFELRDDITPMPAELWQAWVQLAFHMSEKDRRQLEVSCRFLRHAEDKTQWRVCVPPQSVGGASVRADTFDGAIDIISGEVIAHWPPENWIPCGSSHSHNTMASFFSGTDDAYELGDPGLHIVIGDINATKRTYTIKASITAGKRRFIIDHNAVIDTSATKSTFHPDVLSIIQLEPIKIWPTQYKTPSQLNGKRLKLNPNAGNGYPLDADKEDDVLAPWDPQHWYDYHDDDDEIDTIEVEALIDSLVDAASAAGKHRAVEDMLCRLREYIDSHELSFLDSSFQNV